MKGFLFDLGRLVTKYSLVMVRDALLRIRLRPGQKFFPHPTEVAQELETMAEAGRLQRLKDHPYVPCAGEKHYDGGLVVRFDKERNRVMRECACKKQWSEEHRALAGQTKETK